MSSADILDKLLSRLTSAHPGWSEWDQLIERVKSLPYVYVSDAFLGNHFSSDVTFKTLGDRTFPDWSPEYVAALFGMTADDWEMAGGYATQFTGEPVRAGAVFSLAGNDAQLGFPLIEVPEEVFYFQSNDSGALFFLNKQLQILYPNASKKGLDVLDSLEAFTRTSIRQTLAGKLWFEAYQTKIDSGIID